MSLHQTKPHHHLVQKLLCSRPRESKNLQLHDNGIARRGQEQARGRHDVGVAQDGQDLELLLGLFPRLLPPVDELDGHLLAAQDLLAPAYDRKPASAEFLELDVASFEVSLPASVQVRRRVLERVRLNFKNLAHKGHSNDRP